jgi:hypothetical protein
VTGEGTEFISEGKVLIGQKVDGGLYHLCMLTL